MADWQAEKKVPLIDFASGSINFLSRSTVVQRHTDDDIFGCDDSDLFPFVLLSSLSTRSRSF